MYKKKKSGFKAQSETLTGLVEERVGVWKQQPPARERRRRQVTDGKERLAYFFLSLSFLSG